ncbi:MAG: hypothetical protein HKP62_04330 [Sulfurovum sp.]|nr:hypothetical protein [Sulfurovum sp.]NNJ45225.1 hypothetical protein [Sulfurovum sp.]
MNSPIIIAVIASIATVVVFILAGKISNKWAKGAVQIFSVLFGIFLAGAISSDTAISTKSGEYFFYIMITVAILGKILGKKKSAANA